MRAVACAGLLMIAATVGAQTVRVATHGEVSATAALDEPVQPAAHPGEMLLGPAQVRRFYGMDGVPNGGKGETIALIISRHDPRLEDDLRIFSERFGLPQCAAADGCLRQMQVGGAAVAGIDGDDPVVHIAQETCMDVEWAHAMAPQARLIVAEAPSGGWDHYLAAVDAAVAAGAMVVSLSLAEPQRADHRTMYLDGDVHFTAPVVFVSAGGDHAHGSRWPAASPYVVGVGGTEVHTDATGARLGETAWLFRTLKDGKHVGSGGGFSMVETAPVAQMEALPSDVAKASHGMRATPDVSLYAGSRTPFAVYNSMANPRGGASGWRAGGGTSAGAPAWAGILAVANSMRRGAGKKSLAEFRGTHGERAGAVGALYAAARKDPRSFFDITEGGNGDCGVECTAGPGYDTVTGLGTPNGVYLIPALVALP